MFAEGGDEHGVDAAADASSSAADASSTSADEGPTAANASSTVADASSTVADASLTAPTTSVSAGAPSANGSVNGSASSGATPTAISLGALRSRRLRTRMRLGWPLPGHEACIGGACERSQLELLRAWEAEELLPLLHSIDGAADGVELEYDLGLGAEASARDAAGICTHFPHMSHPILPIFQNLIRFF